ncbi:hypothetical protein RP20_CCG005039 [Aedes albopictus]|nr:hypothetical protein RP20_CCG005039 [Aedes albopictus]
MILRRRPQYCRRIFNWNIKPKPRMTIAYFPQGQHNASELYSSVAGVLLGDY